MTKLFISYAHEDKRIVCPLTNELQGLGFDVWIDTRLRAGTLWGLEIVGAITHCNFFVLFVSSVSAKSDSVRREVDLAYKKGSKIIPVRLEKVNIPSEWDYQLAGIQWIEFEEADWKSRLLVALGNPTTVIPTTPTINPGITAGNTPEEQQITTEGNVNKNSHASNLIPDHILNNFRREFINPTECDLVSSFLRDLANELSLDAQYLHLQFSLKRKILALVSQIDDFRKICQYTSHAADNEKQKILDDLEKLANHLPDQNV